MNKLFTDEAWNDYIYWFNTDKKILEKINDLIKEIERTPFTGKGKLKIEITCMKTRNRLLIILLQLLAFFSYIGCFVYLTYKADKELILLIFL